MVNVSSAEVIFYTAALLVDSILAADGPTDSQKASFLYELNVLRKCGRQNYLSRQQTDFLINEVLNFKQLPPSSQSKCWTMCHFEGVNLLDRNGNIIWDNIIELKRSYLFRREDVIRAEQIVATCRRSWVNVEDICDNAHNAINCYHRIATQLNARRQRLEDYE